jgi:hypothetical protein
VIMFHETTLYFSSLIVQSFREININWTRMVYKFVFILRNEKNYTNELD